MKTKKKFGKNKRILIYLLFVVFIFLRLFFEHEEFFVTGDQGKYLELASNFPSHTLDNNQLFLTHGTMFPYVIRFFTIFFEDHIAGLLVSFFSAAVSFFIIYLLFNLITKNFYVVFSVLVLYTLSVDNILLSQLIMKESFTVMLFLLTIYFYLRGLIHGKNFMFLSALFGGILALTSDHVILTLPIFALSYLVFKNEKTNMLYAAIPIVLTAGFYLFWIFIRFGVYTSFVYYPAGVDGTIENVDEFGPYQLINNHFFDETALIIKNRPSDLKHYAYETAYLFNFQPFSVTKGIFVHNVFEKLRFHHIIFILLIYIPMALIFLYNLLLIIADFFRKWRIHNNYRLYFLLVFLILMFPITRQASQTRMILPATIFLYFLIADGGFRILNKFKFKKFYSCSLIVAILLLLVIPFWFFSHQNPLFLLGKSGDARNTAKFLSTLPKDGVMGQFGYTPMLNYFTDKRIIAMPSDSERLMFLIDHYDINYLVYGSRFYTSFEEGNKESVVNYNSIKYIRENPDRFQLIAVIEEDYSGFTDVDNKDQIYVYEVIDGIY